MIEYRIFSENPSEHWSHFKCQNQNVLDLGCGRMDAKNPETMTPFYFSNNGAYKVLGIDVLDEEIQFFNSINKNSSVSFMKASVKDPYLARQIINDHKITAIKCDIEGSELFFLGFTSEDYKNINSIAIEYHGLWIKNLLLPHFIENKFELSVHGILNPEYGVLFLNKT